MTTGDGQVPGGSPEGDLGEDLDVDPGDDLLEELRRNNPVDVEALPPSRSAEAMRTLEQILGSADDTEPEPDMSDPDMSEPDMSEPETSDAETSESSPSPAAGDRGGREEPPPCPT